MVDFYAYTQDGRLYFLYRGRNWFASPARFLNATELTAVAASAYDANGGSIPVTQQPSYVAALGAYIGWIDTATLHGLKFISIKMVPTVGPGIPSDWAPTKTQDVNLEESLEGAGEVVFRGVQPVY